MSFKAFPGVLFVCYHQQSPHTTTHNKVLILPHTTKSSYYHTQQSPHTTTHNKVLILPHTTKSSYYHTQQSPHITTHNKVLILPHTTKSSYYHTQQSPHTTTHNKVLILPHTTKSSHYHTQQSPHTTTHNITICEVYSSWPTGYVPRPIKCDHLCVYIGQANEKTCHIMNNIFYILSFYNILLSFVSWIEPENIYFLSHDIQVCSIVSHLIWRDFL